MSDDVSGGYRDGIVSALLLADKEINRLRAEVERLKAREITDAEIDAAWEKIRFISTQGVTGATIALVLEDLLGMFKIVECAECGGMGTTEHDAGVEIVPLSCSNCHGHKWIREEQGDE
jgi:hypothetical protein